MIFTILFSGCVSNIEVEPAQVIQKNKKVFEEEDTLIMFGLRAEQIQDYESAAIIFDNIYNKSNRVEYLYRSLQNYLVLKDNEKVIQKVDEMLQDNLDNDALLRLKIVALVQLNLLKEAELLALEVVEKSREVDDYILVSNIYVRQKRFDIAVKYLESAYLKNYNEKILDRMSIVLYVNLNRKKDAIAQLETHSMVHGCSIVLCKRLMAFYSNNNDVDGLLSTYLRYYKIDSNKEVAKKIVQLYGYKKEYAKLMLFLESSNSDDKSLLQLYVSAKDYKKASKLADKLYEKTGNIKYLGDSTIYEYESQNNKTDKKFLKRISKRFENVIANDDSTLYLNYYGYILIDHDLDIKKGIKYVKKALKIEPNSAYYLDSLAWGLYKLGKYKESLSIIEKVIKLEGGDDPEVLKHYKIIEDSTKIKKVKNKNDFR